MPRICFVLMKKITAIAMVVILSACSSAPERSPVPRELTTKAGIPGVPEARFWGDEWPKFSEERFRQYTDAEFKMHFSGIYGEPHNTTVL